MSSSTSSNNNNNNFSLMSPNGEIQILNQVSKMTLEEPRTPLSSAFRTPQIRKRKPFSVVTPPRGHVIVPSDDIIYQRSTLEEMRHKINNRDMPPMLPDSIALDAPASSNHNPFMRHRPIHSPFVGGSNLNAEFLSTLQESSSIHRMPKMSRRPCRNLLFDAVFPVLDEEDANHCQDDVMMTGRALKMRRRSKDEYPIFESNL